MAVAVPPLMTRIAARLSTLVLLTILAGAASAGCFVRAGVGDHHDHDRDWDHDHHHEDRH